MATDKPLLLVAAGALVALGACATIAGLEDPDPTPSNADGTGREPAPGIALKPESISLTTSCAGGGAPSYITLENQNDAAASYELQVPEGSAFALRDETDASVTSVKGTVPAKGLVLVYVHATPTKAGSFAGQVIVRIDDHVTQVPVQVTVDGGALALSPSLIDFGEVRKNTTSQPQTVEIENTGTEPVNLLGFAAASGGGGPEFAIDLGSGSVNIAPQAKVTATATLLPGEDGPPITAIFEPTTQEPTCGELPKLTLKGSRVNQDVTVNPVSLDFGDVACQSSGGASRVVTVTNYGNAVAAFTLAVPPSSWFDVTTDATTVPAANGTTPSTRAVTVTLKPVGAALGSHSAPIEIEVTSPAPAKKTTVTASTRSVGALLTITPTSLSDFDPEQTRSFTLRNTGNKFVYLRHTSSNTGAFRIVNNGSETALAPGLPFPLSVDVQFVAQSGGTHSADISTVRTSSPPLLPESGNLCEPAPVVKLSGTR